MSSNLSLSVVVPTFNSEATLSRTLLSIASQRELPLEILIIDGESSDNTLSIAKSFDKLPIEILSEKDEGVYHAMNKGVARARGDIVSILNSDDEWMPDMINRILCVFENSPEIDIVHGNIEYVSVKARREIKPSKGILRKIGFGLPSVHPATFVRSSVYSRLGYFDYLKFPVCADQAFIYQCLFSGAKLHHIDQIITIMHAGGISSNRDYKKEIDEIFELFPPVYRLIGRAAWRSFESDTSWFNGERRATWTSTVCHFIYKRLPKCL